MRVTHCDGPDCDNLTSFTEDEDGDIGWLHLDSYNDEDCGDFCSWECLAASSLTHALGDT